MMFLVSGVLLVFVGKLVYRFGKDQIAKYRFNQTLEQLRAEVRNQRHVIQNVQVSTWLDYCIQLLFSYNDTYN